MTEILNNLKISPKKLEDFGFVIKQDGVVRTAYQLLSFPNFDFKMIEKIWQNEFSHFEQNIKKQVEINASYLSYVKRQDDDINIFRQEEQLKIPLDINYNLIQSLSNEV
ncbi:MAG: tRNA uridine-5-carboxymethylaminomethyl(34) synthesis enzyme MnmG, partial [Alphaproteobacteria bacterium]